MFCFNLAFVWMAPTGIAKIVRKSPLGTCAANQRIIDGATNLARCDLGLMGRELGVGLIELNRGVYIWGVQYLNGTVYASDMVNGIWKLKAVR